MNYIGSKYTLRPFLEQVYNKITDGSEKVLCDVFAGTGAVGRHFKQLGLRIIANDLQYYAYVLNKAYLEINEQPLFIGLREKYASDINKYHSAFEKPVQEVLSFINALPGVSGFITQNYSPEGSRLYYIKENAQKADAIRQAIKEWFANNLITEQEYFYILCSLLEAIDQVANTASVYGAFLKEFKKSAKKELRLKPLRLTSPVENCKVFNKDANELIKEIKCDILYLDPPYNHRQYGANYHVLETIASYDNPVISGITGMRDYKRSLYCQVNTVKKAFKELIESAHTKHILVSYNDEGLMSFEDVHSILKLRGEPITFKTDYNRFKADNNREYKRKATVEYIHYVKVVDA